MRLIEGDHNRDHWRFQEGGDIWRCPICHAVGRGDQIAVIEMHPFVELRRGKTRKAAKVLCCATCFIVHGKITEV